jgi:hypothetical protein
MNGNEIFGRYSEKTVYLQGVNLDITKFIPTFVRN